MKSAALKSTAVMALTAAIAFVFFAGLGGLDSPAEQVEAAVRKCGTALSMKHLDKAENYCREATRKASEAVVGAAEAADAYWQLAALRVAQKRVVEAAEACRSAMAFWRELPAQHYARERADRGMAKCMRLIDDAKALPSVP